MIRVRGVCFYNSARAIVLPEVGMATTRKERARSAAQNDQSIYPAQDPTDTSAPPRTALSTPAQRAVEDMRRQIGILERFLHDLDLKDADEEHIERLQELNAALATRNSEQAVWLGMVKTTLVHHDAGELSARQFANEIDAIIKGWEEGQ